MTWNIAEIEENVTAFEDGSRRIVVIGTAHVSQASVDLVNRYIHSERPEIVCIELCKPRLEAMRNPTRWQDTDIVEVIRSGRAYVLFSQLFLGAFQKKLAKSLGVKPGAEMEAAINAANEIGALILPIDREIKITLKRLWSKLGLFSLFRLTFSLFGKVDVSEEEIENLKRTDSLKQVLDELSKTFPQLANVLINERDLFMCQELAKANSCKVLAVVGAGHTPGMKDNFGKINNVDELNIIPLPSLARKISSWAIPVLIIGMFVYGFFSAGSRVSVEMLERWAITCGGLSALGAVISLAHPLTIITALIVAPFTTLHPALAAGWFCGLVEAILRRPKVKDFQTISDDIGTIKGIYTNRLSRVLLVMLLTNLGAAAGMLIGSYQIAKLLG